MKIPWSEADTEVRGESAERSNIGCNQATRLYVGKEQIIRMKVVHYRSLEVVALGYQPVIRHGADEHVTLTPWKVTEAKRQQPVSAEAGKGLARLKFHDCVLFERGFASRSAILIKVF
ncbi:hypothetical protein CS053_14805 [Rhodanobacter glycinis]|uniref:Uncharacterized protein n=1 Tax=Rhodanobacter glycinis TaxID=582702 RepID=A0A5B9E1R6_9GAMM|nr:hypothetical protein [Rhodanobacter glycinis]QEE25629.1 hypothetical protein CS053_14805 [Rhodanobacter glycinis]